MSRGSSGSRLHRSGLLCCSAALVAASTAPGQDSVALTPGNSDALASDGPQIVRYVVDLVPVASSWGNGYVVGPILKASADADPLFPTQVLGAHAVSADDRLVLNFAPTDFGLWTTPGTGVHPSENAAPSTVSVNAFDRRFGIAVNDFSTEATNIIGALVGQNTSNPARLHVTRVLALASRSNAAGADTATLSLGAIDADGHTHVRADDYNTDDALAVTGENILTVDIEARGASVNTISSTGAADAAATTLVITDDPVTLNTPVALPASVGAPTALTFDFAVSYRPGAGAGTTAHLAAGVVAHRGNPSLTLGGLVGAGAATVAGLGVTSAVNDRADTINLFTVDGAGAVTDKDHLPLPSPVSDGSFSTNAAGDAEFHHYYSQLSFRGPSGPVGLGMTGPDPVIAATALDPADGEFIAVATLTGAAPTWTVAAFIGKEVLDGPGGTPVAVIIGQASASISSPAVDNWGNVYFVAAVEPAGGGAEHALVKAVRTASGYELERIIATGDAVEGANSGRTYTIDELTLADGDSVASGAVHGGCILRQPLPGFEATAAGQPNAFGGILVNAEITYDNGGTPESYQAALFVGPALTPLQCPGDANGDLSIDFEDLNIVLNEWGTSGPDGDVAPHPDGDGAVNFTDLNLVLAEWGNTCN